MPDLYQILGVDRTASKEAIQAAFRSRVWSAHPDTGGSAGAFQELHRAYQVLMDEQERARYDATGEVEGWQTFCQRCKKPLQGKNQKRFCSSGCAVRFGQLREVHPRFCAWCGFPFIRMATIHYCGQKCRDESKKELCRRKERRRRSDLVIAEKIRLTREAYRCRNRAILNQKQRDRVQDTECRSRKAAYDRVYHKSYRRKREAWDLPFREKNKERRKQCKQKFAEFHRMLRLAGTLLYVSQTLEGTMSANLPAHGDEFAKTIADMNAKGTKELKRIVEDGLNVVKAALMRSAAALQVLDARNEECTANVEWLRMLRGIYEEKLAPEVVERYAMKCPEVIKRIAKLPIEEQRRIAATVPPEEAKERFIPARKKPKPDVLESIIPTDDGLIKVRYAAGLEALMEPREAVRLGRRLVKMGEQMLPGKAPV